MTNEQINKAIQSLMPDGELVGLKKRGLWYRPDACGYTSCECEAGRYTMEEAKKCEYLHDEPVTIHHFQPKRFTEDLNACAEMERTLGELEKRPYVYQLAELMKPQEWTVMAPACQRCEAFLRVKGLWEDGK